MRWWNRGGFGDGGATVGCRKRGCVDSRSKAGVLRGTPVVAGGFASIVLAGCAHDCEQRYCDVVRAGASGWFAHELQCCRRPDSPGCDDRETRLQAFSVLATQMREACEAANWDRFRDLWNETVPLLPAGVLLLVAEDFCDGWDWAGCNVSTPFAATDSASAMLLLDSEPPRLRLADLDRDADSDDDAAPAPDRPVVVHRWVVRSGSTATVHAFGRRVELAASGGLTIVESLEPGGLGAGDDLESWCRRMRPTAMSIDLETTGGAVSLRLDPGFEGNQVRFDEPGRGVVGVAVSIDGTMTLPTVGSLDVSTSAAYLELPFDLALDGTLQLLPDGAWSMLDLWPVDPVVEAWIRGEDPVAASEGDDVACIEQARAVATAFLALHPGCSTSR